MESSSKEMLHINAASSLPVKFSADDFGVFILTQSQAAAAAKRFVQGQDREREIGEDIASWVYRLRRWCEVHRVASCVVSPRMDDIMVVVTARDEDRGGSLHDEMSELDIESFKKNGLRLSWLLLRATESDGLAAFIDPAAARTIYRAES